MRRAYSQYLPDSAAVGPLSRRSAVPPKPRVEVLNLHAVLHRDVRHRDSDRIQSFRYCGDPLLSAKRGEPECNGFVKCGGRHLRDVVHAFHIPYRDMA